MKICFTSFKAYITTYKNVCLLTILSFRSNFTILRTLPTTIYNNFTKIQDKATFKVIKNITIKLKRSRKRCTKFNMIEKGVKYLCGGSKKRSKVKIEDGGDWQVEWKTKVFKK